MPGFQKLTSREDALRLWLGAIPKATEFEIIPASQALGRTLAEDVLAPIQLPQFRRSTMDGYAVRAVDTDGAALSSPVSLRLAGEIRMGRHAAAQLSPGHAAAIHTGGMLPPGADAVVIREDCRPGSEGMVEALQPVNPGENVIQPGEDVEPGDKTLPKGALLDPARLAGLAAFGITSLPVLRKPRVAVLSGGDELVPPDQQPGPGQVRDINTTALENALRFWGADPMTHPILADDYDQLYTAARSAIQTCNALVVTAGSSVGERDLTARVIANLGQPGILAHGLNIKPGKPAILAVCSGKPVLGLPGNPVSALVIAGLFIPPMLNVLMGFQPRLLPPPLTANLASEFVSETKREEWVPVRLSDDIHGLKAEPIRYKSNLIFTLASADGLLRVPAETKLIPAGQGVLIYRLY